MLLRPSAASADVVLPGGTIVRVHTVATLSSATSRAGDTFLIVCDEDVTAGSQIVVRKGAQGRARVVDVDGARGNGHSGSLGLAFEYVFGADGKAIPLFPAPQHFVEGDRKGAASTATIVGYAAIGVTGLFAHNFAPGRQKAIDYRESLTSFVDHDVLVAP